MFISLVSAVWNVSDLDSNLVCAAVFMLGRERSAIVLEGRGQPLCPLCFQRKSYCIICALRQRAIVFFQHPKKELLHELIVSFFESDKEG